MKEEVVTTTVYIAEDGKRFTEKSDCEKYEKEVLALKKNIKYFKVLCNPDLTETGCMQGALLVAVYCRNLCHRDVVENWCVKQKGMEILGEGVQGYGFQRHFVIANSSEKEYLSFKEGNKMDSRIYMNEQLFLSPVEVAGYPKPFNYMEAWNFK